MTRRIARAIGIAFAGLLAVGSGCGGDRGSTTSADAGPQYLGRDALLDPAACQGCHPNHFDDWSGSMHAYASDDPVFRAMNARGQRETNGALGSFCVQCHAPMALHEGATTDGLDLDQVPAKLHGVTCFFCHSVASVTGSHDAALTLADDTVMRGEYADPIASTAHASAYSTLHDRDRADSASLCGACHDVVTPAGGAIERTYAEWQASVFSHTSGGETCGECHMPQSTSTSPIASVPNAPARYLHGHDVPAVDVALTPGFANASAEQAAVQAELATTLQTALCVTAQGGVRVLLDNVAAGHDWPSGSAQDRRAWTEVIAYSGASTIYASGAVPDGTPVVSVTNDPDLWLLRDCMFDAQGTQVDMFWQAASTEGNELPFPVTFDPSNQAFYQTHIEQRFPRMLNAVLPFMPDRVTLRVRIQPIGLDVLNDLVASGDLDPSIAAAVPTLDVLPLLEWTLAAATLTYQDDDGTPVACVSATAFNVGATKTTATNHTKCAP